MISENGIDFPCCNRARHLIPGLAANMEALGSRGSLSTDSEVRAVIFTSEAEATRSDQPLQKPQGGPLLRSDQDNAKALSAEVVTLRRQLAEKSANAAIKSAAKNSPSVAL